MGLPQEQRMEVLRQSWGTTLEDHEAGRVQARDGNVIFVDFGKTAGVKGENTIFSLLNSICLDELRSIVQRREDYKKNMGYDPDRIDPVRIVEFADEMNEVAAEFYRNKVSLDPSLED